MCSSTQGTINKFRQLIYNQRNCDITELLKYLLDWLSTLIKKKGGANRVKGTKLTNTIQFILVRQAEESGVRGNKYSLTV